MGEGRGGAHLANQAHLANPEEPRWGGGHLARAATPANQLQLAHSVTTDAPDVPLHAILAVVSQKSLPAESLGLLVSGGVNKEMRR